MKQVFCYLVFFCLVLHASAQQNIFFKKEKPKYTIISKSTDRHHDKNQQLLSPISYYATTQQLKKPYKIYMPQPYIDNNSKDVFLYIIGLGSSILGSIYTEKLHYNYNRRLYVSNN